MKQPNPKEKVRKFSPKVVSNDSKKAQSTMLAKTAKSPPKIRSEFVSALTSEKLHVSPMVVTESSKSRISKKLTGERGTVVKKKNPIKSASASNIPNIKADGAKDVQKMLSRSLVGKEVARWDAEEVETFFIQKEMPDEGAILRKEQVDGLSLLLLQRNDVIHGLGFRVGPALKVYRLIYELQTNKLECIV